MIIKDYLKWFKRPSIPEMLNESVSTETSDEIVINTTKPNGAGHHVTKTADYHIIYDISSKLLWIVWINIKTNKFKGIDILMKLIEIAKSKGCIGLTADWETGIIQGIEANGYYVGMKWGFLPDKGIKFVNDILKTEYPNFKAMFDDPNFLKMWKEAKVPYSGTFDLSTNSISWQQLNKNFPIYK